MSSTMQTPWRGCDPVGMAQDDMPRTGRQVGNASGSPTGDRRFQSEVLRVRGFDVSQERTALKESRAVVVFAVHTIPWYRDKMSGSIFSSRFNIFHIYVDTIYAEYKVLCVPGPARPSKFFPVPNQSVLVSLSAFGGSTGFASEGCGSRNAETWKFMTGCQPQSLAISKQRPDVAVSRPRKHPLQTFR